MFVSEKTIFVVQTKWMKEVLVDKHNINKDNVYIIRPEVNIPKNLFQNPVVKHRSKKLLYPATTVFYKNHLLVLEALKLLKESDGIEGVVFQVTFNKTEYPQFDQAVSRSNLHSHIEYLGVIPYERLMTQYREAALILFPSYVETFGLPLAEAAILGKLILCSDLPYSRDVLENYSGARFLDYQQPQLWADEIKKSIDSDSDDLLLNQRFDFKQVSTWDDFFKLI
jgi:glycosyltransferase involved in cell wall biosynthesis